MVFEKPSALQTRFFRLLWIKALIERQSIGCVMIDDEAMVNVMSTLFVKKLGKSEDELRPTDTTMTDSTRSNQRP